MNRLLTIMICALTAMTGSAQTPVENAGGNAPTIVDRINASGVAMVFQPARLNSRLAPKAAATQADVPATEADKPAATHTGGYRIQLYAGNNARTAKNQASQRASVIDSRFPEYATYVTFDAPYWRLKVGDFRSYEDASAALARLKAALPEYAGEMRLVRERITPRD